MAHGKLCRIVLTSMLALSLLLSCLPALGEDEFPEGAYPFHIEGNAGNFGVRNNRLMIPDCLVVNVKSTYTAWEPNGSYNTQLGIQDLFDELKACEVLPYAMPSDGEYASYYYAGIRLYLESTNNPDSVAIINLRPTNYIDVPAFDRAVDMRIDLYENYTHEDETHTYHSVRLKSDTGNIWDMIVFLSLENYKPTDLLQTSVIEYHSLQNDPLASACPSPNPPTLRNENHIRKIVQVLLEAEEMPHLMAATDLLHLRFVSSDEKAYNVYLQEVSEWSQGRSEPDTLYARMGGFCYKVDKDAMFDALDEAGCPDVMFQA